MIQIRDVSLDDTNDILKIYEYYILNTAITFEITVPSLEEFKERISKISKKYPYIVLLEDGIIKGYAYSHEFYGREAYRFSNEVSIYIDKDSKGKGFGKLLYNELENRLKKLGILNLYACIAIPNGNDMYLDNNSQEFHSHIGYEKVGKFNNCGYKFNRWYSLVWMEKIIGEHK